MVHVTGPRPRLTGNVLSLITTQPRRHLHIELLHTSLPAAQHCAERRQELDPKACSTAPAPPRPGTQHTLSGPSVCRCACEASLMQPLSGPFLICSPHPAGPLSLIRAEKGQHVRNGKNESSLCQAPQGSRGWGQAEAAPAPAQPLGGRGCWVLWKAQDRLSHRARWPGARSQLAARLPQEKDRPFPCLVPRKQEKGQRGREEDREGPHHSDSPRPRPSPAGLLGGLAPQRWPGWPCSRESPYRKGTQLGLLAQQGRPFSTLLLNQQTKDSCSQPVQGWGRWPSPQEAREMVSAAQQSRAPGIRNCMHLCSLSRV